MVQQQLEADPDDPKKTNESPQVPRQSCRGRARRQPACRGYGGCGHRDRNVGVMINLPFGRGRLFDATRAKSLPPWAADFDCASWAQFFLKYIISHEAVTCAIPGMARPQYVVDNMGAATGRLPDPAMRKRMEAFIDAL